MAPIIVMLITGKVRIGRLEIRSKRTAYAKFLILNNQSGESNTRFGQFLMHGGLILKDPKKSVDVRYVAREPTHLEP